MSHVGVGDSALEHQNKKITSFSVVFPIVLWGRDNSREDNAAEDLVKIKR